MSEFKKQPKLTELQEKIIKEWEKVFLAHPSHTTIARKLKCSKETVHRAIQKYLTTKRHD